MEDFGDVISCWPTYEILCREYERVTGTPLSVNTVKGWARRRRVPAEYWMGLLISSREHRYGLTPQMFIDMAAEWRE